MADLELAREIARAVRNAGGRALIVGGWVRDKLLAHTSKDIDLEVYGIPAKTLVSLLARFGPVNTVGESFTVYKVGSVDIALPRRESKIGRGQRLGTEVLRLLEIPTYLLQTPRAVAISQSTLLPGTP